MKNILFLTHYFPPEVNAPANRTFEHAIRWVKDDIDVTVITNYPNHPHGKLYTGYQNQWFFTEQIQGIKVVRVKTFLTPNAGKIRRSINFLVYMVMSIWASFYIKSVNVIIATSPQFFCGIAGALISRIKCKPFILEIRDLWPDSITAVNAVRKNILIRILIRIEKWMYFSASKIITLTDSFKAHIVGYGYSECQVKTITNGIDFHRMSIEKPGLDLFDKRDRFILSYIGTFGLAHKLEIVLRTAELLKTQQDIHFLLIGDGADRKHLETVKRNMSIDNVTILKLQPKDKIPYFLEISDAGLIMLKNNTLFKTVIPSKMFEYMAKKKPIIVSVPKGEATGIAQKYNCGLVVQPENPAELKRAILKLYHDPDLRATLGENGYSAVYQFFNRDSLARKMLELILDVC
ncbi:MAG: glycosyltransferase family 4 protein [Candidatus Marinimicrobia bacterium]|nr:glycosyltransferase family 4 protein [Candidatus Neomarinimicrobiota bacterium]